VASAKRHGQVRRLRDLIAHANAAGAQNAALLVENDVLADVDDLALADLVALVARKHAVPVEIVALQAAFAGLVADGTVDGMVEQREFEHLPPHIQHLGRVGRDLHLVGDGGVAGRYRLGRALDFDQTLAAHRGRRQPRVVTEERYLGPHRLASFEQVGALRELVFLAVDEDGHAFDGWGSFSCHLAVALAADHVDHAEGRHHVGKKQSGKDLG
jgi:hypothetical protein